MTKPTGTGIFTARFAGLLRAPVRFPLTLACGVGWAGVTIAREHFGSRLEWDRVEQVQLYLLLGFFASLAATLFAEGREWPAWRRLLLSAAALGLAVLIAYTGPAGRDLYESPAFLFMGPGLVLLMIVAPFLRRGAKNYAIWEFNFRCWTSAAFGLVVALVIALGGMAFLGALEELFGLNISGKYYGDVWIVSMSVLWPWQTLAGVPGGFKETQTDNTPRWAEYLISWLLIPLALLYMALLYLFAAKIVFQWGLPRGQVGWLVGGFAGYGLAVWHAAYPLRETGNHLVRTYFRFFHVALFLPVLLLAVGTAARVAEYGVTEKRYGLLVITVWLAGIATYGVWKRAPRLSIAPVSFAVLLILATFGPWGASAVSIRSQLGQLQALLAEAGIFAEGQIKPGEGVAGPQEVKRISSIVRYLRVRGRSEALVDWLGAAGVTTYVDVSDEDILAALGLEYVEEWEESGYFSYSAMEVETIDIAGFDIYHTVQTGSETDTTVSSPTTGQSYAIGLEDSILVITSENQPGERVVFNLADLAETMRERRGETNDTVMRKLMTLEDENGGMRVRFYVYYLSGQRVGDLNDITFGNGLLLIGRAE